MNKVHILPSCFTFLSTIRTYCTKNNLKRTNFRKPRTINVSNAVWNAQQISIIEAVERGESVFITGSAGTGKTILIRHLIKLLLKIYDRKSVFVTASTGVAACAVRGQTLQSFAGVGLADADAETLFSRVLGNRRAFNRWKQAKALVIDEISMVDKTLFEKYEYIARKVRCEGGECDEPWGGLQVVVSGDFFQLPPVDTKRNGVEFAFEADCWENTFQLQVSLETVFRQSESEHVRLLEGVRRGEIDSEGLALLEDCCSEEEPDETVVRLFPKLKDVDRVNKSRLSALKEKIIVYKAFDQTVNDHGKNQLKHVIAPENLDLCKGARVMLIRNLNVKQNLVNGSTGTVIGFQKSRTRDIVKICGHDGDKLLPIVEFDSGWKEVVKPDEWEVADGGKVIAKRLQLPLMLAWATSIHKSQGMTLDRLHTDLSEAFGCGMVYVALSRVKSLDGLSLSGFDPSKIKAHPKVLEYYKKCF
ncbi:hypothetical protein RND81_05G232000 [Saponaria officinalis]|uniref:ATP-dependent DNA helicase n=1 Tax=Saponaria officinalis TaxID=3572 RepID=A0AAW1KVL7_SAPOF